MTNTPVFNDTLARHRFTALPAEYTDRYTPEQARQAGDTYGRQQHNQAVLSMLKTIKKPSKALQHVIETLEELEWH